MPPIRIKKIITGPYLLVFLAHLLILAIWSYFVWFSKNGHVVYVDVTEGLNSAGTFSKYFFTFDDNWGDALAEKQRVVLIYPLILLFRVFNISFQNFIPIKFLYLYLLSLIGFLICINVLLKTFKYKRGYTSAQLFTWLFLSSAIYLYNPWFANRLMHFGLFFSTFILPIVFALTIAFFNKRVIKYSYLILLSLLLGFFTTTPHTFLLYLFLVAPILVFALSKKKYKHLLLFCTLLPIAFFFYGAFWLVPFFSYAPAPDRVESLDVFLMLSRNSGIFNVLKLHGYWWELLPSYNFDSPKITDPLFYFIYLSPFFLSVAALIKLKGTLRYIFVGVISLVLLFGTSNIVNIRFYSWLLNVPYMQNYSWLFREPEKLSYLLSLTYSILAFFLLIKSNESRRKLYVGLLSILLAVYFVYSISVINKNFYKSTPPKSYTQVNDLLQYDNSDYNVAVYPQIQYSDWSNIDSTNYFINLSIKKPVVPLSEQDSRTRYYFNYLFDENNISSIDLASELRKMGVKYIIIRKDSKYFDTNSLIVNLKKADNILLLKNYDSLAVFQNMLFAGVVSTYPTTITTNLGLNGLKEVYISGFADSTILDYSDLTPSVDNIGNNLYLIDSNGIIDLTMRAFANKMYFPSDIVIKTDPNPNFAKMSLTDQNHADSSFYFYNNGLDNSQFNYEKPVIFSMGGVQVKSVSKRILDKSIEVGFSPSIANKVKVGINTYNISYTNGLSKSKNNELNSDFVNVAGRKAINIRSEVKAPYILQPHILIKYFDSSSTLIETKGYYPSQNYKIDITSQVPDKAEQMQISLVSLSTYNNVEVEYKDFIVKDVSNNFMKPSVSFKYKNNCNSECLVFARVIKSPKSGLLKFSIDGVTYNVITRGLDNKFVWVPIGDEFENPTSFSITNVTGINSVAAVLVVGQKEYQSEYLDISNKIASFEHTINFNNISKLYYNDTLNLKVRGLPVDKKSSVSYTVYSDNLSANSTVIFGKPTNNQWLLNGEPLNTVNGFLNGSAVGAQADRESSISYRPQKYFNIGLYISFTAFILLTPIIFTSPKQ